jgi:DNA-binding beta-propeller fold protein YncE
MHGSWMQALFRTGLACKGDSGTKRHPPPLLPPLLWAWLRAWLLALATAGAAAQSEPVPSAPQLRIEAGMHTAAVNRIDTDAAGRYAVTSSNDKTARVWEVASGRLLKVLRPPIGPGNEGKLFAVAISPDGGTVAVAGWTGVDWSGRAQVYLFDRQSGHLNSRLGGLPDVVYHLRFSPDGRWLAATLKRGHGLRVWDWRSGQPALADKGFGAASYGASWSRDGRLVVSSWDSKLRLYRIGRSGSLDKIAEAAAPGGKQPFAVAFHPDGSRIAVGYVDSTRVDVVDGQSLAGLYSPSTTGGDDGSLGNVAWSADGRSLVAAGRWGVKGKSPVRLWPDAGRGQPQDIPTAGNTVLDLMPLPAGGWLLAAGDPAWGVLSPQGRWQPLGLPPTADLRGSRGDAFVLAAGGTRVQFGFEPGGKPPHVFDLARRTLQAGTLAGAKRPDTTALAVQNWQNRADPTLGGQPLPLENYEISRSLAIAPGSASFVLGTEWLLRHFDAGGKPLW